jgi:glycosyltransferase involved in cell wall biosynthesis
LISAFRSQILQIRNWLVIGVSCYSPYHRLMRIALFTETFLPKIDGIVTRLRNTISELQRSGHQVLVFAPNGGVCEHDGAQVEGLRGTRFPLYPELTLALPRASIRNKLLAFNPDVIHVADPSCLGVAGIYYADVLKLPLVISYHTRLPKYLHYYGLSALEPLVWKIMRLRHNKAQINLCTSTVMADELHAHGIKRLSLWPKAVDTNEFHPRFASDEMRGWLSNGHAESPLFLYVGRLSPEKGIEALRQVLEAIPGSRLAIVGGGPSETALRIHFAGSNTFFAGYLTGRKLAEAMASATALVLPSKTETLGLVLMEAMAAGSVVIGANAGGIPDIVRHEVNGFLFDPDGDGDLAKVAARAVQDRGLCAAIRQKAREQAEEWSWAVATQELVRLYEIATRMPLAEKPQHAKAPWMLAMKRAAIGGMKLFLS